MGVKRGMQINKTVCAAMHIHRYPPSFPIPFSGILKEECYDFFVWSNFFNRLVKNKKRPDMIAHIETLFRTLPPPDSKIYLG